MVLFKEGKVAGHHGTCVGCLLGTDNADASGGELQPLAKEKFAEPEQHACGCRAEIKLACIG